MATQKYPHFNPAKYDLQVKISSVKTGSHSKHNLNYHFVWIPKYRKKLLTGRVAEVLKDIIGGNCFAYCGAEFLPESIPVMTSKAG